MYKTLKFRLMNQLKAEMDYVIEHETDKMTKFDKMLQIKNIMQVIENYEKIEPKIAESINDLAKERRFDKEDR